MFSSRNLSTLNFYIMPRKALPNGELGRGDCVNLTNLSGNHARPCWSHANWVTGFHNKRNHFVNQGLWWPPHDVPTVCLSDEDAWREKDDGNLCTKQLVHNQSPSTLAYHSRLKYNMVLISLPHYKERKYL